MRRRTHKVRAAPRNGRRFARSHPADVLWHLSVICEQKSPDMRSPAARHVALKACCYLSGSVTACWAEPQIMALRKPPPTLLLSRQRGVEVSRPAAIWGCRRRLWVHLSAHASCESASDRTQRSLEAQGRRREAATKTSSRSNVLPPLDAPGTCSLLNAEPCCVVMALSQSSTGQRGKL